MSDSSKKRSKLFKKIVELKQKQKEKLQKIRQKMKHLERQNLSTSGFSKLTQKSIKIIQTQRRANVILIRSEFKKIENISRDLTSFEEQYMKLSSK